MRYTEKNSIRVGCLALPLQHRSIIQLLPVHFVQALGHKLNKPALWRWNRRTVSNSVLIGLFVAMLPIPMQMPLAALVAVLFTANLPLAVGLVWLSNPLTIVPLGWICMNIGCAFLGVDMNVMSLLGDGDYMAVLNKFWKPLFIGSITFGFCISIVGYCITFALFRLRTGYRWSQRKRSLNKY